MRQPILTTVVGKKGVGKTWRTLIILKQYVIGNPAKGIVGRRVLILDVNDEFTTVPSIALKDVGLFSFHPKIEMRRVRPYKDNSKKMSLEEISAALNYILENFKYGLLLVEDITKFVADSPSKDLIGGIVTQRHYECDIILHFQTIGKAGHPKILGNTNVLRMHKTGDTVDRHFAKFEDKYAQVKIAETIVNYKHRGTEIDGKWVEPDARFYLYCNFDTEKIIGDFTFREAQRAVREFIWANEKDLIAPMMRQRNEHGKPIYAHEGEAHKEKQTELMDLYFDF